MRTKRIITGIIMAVMFCSCSRIGNEAQMTGDPKTDAERYANLMYNTIKVSEENDAEDIMAYLAYEGASDFGDITKRGFQEIANTVGPVLNMFGLNEDNEDLRNLTNMVSGMVELGAPYLKKMATDSVKINHGKELLADAIEFKNKCENEYKSNTTEDEYKRMKGKYFDFVSYCVRARGAVIGVYGAEKGGLISQEEAQKKIHYVFEPQELMKEIKSEQDKKIHEEYENWKNVK